VHFGEFAADSRWAVIAAVLIGLIAYAMMIWVAEEATEPQPQQPPPVAIEG